MSGSPSKQRQAKKSEKKSNLSDIDQLMQGIQAQAEQEEAYDISLVRDIDFKPVVDFDPSLKDGWYLKLSKKIQMELQLDPNSSPQMMRTFEEMQIRVYQKDSPFDQVPCWLKIELSSEDDVQFFYHWQLSEHQFPEFRYRNNMTIEFGQLINTLTQLFTDYETRPHMYKMIFTLEDDNANAQLTFYQDSEFCMSKLLTLDGFRQLLEEEAVNERVSYIIRSTNEKTRLVQNRIADLIQIIDEHNPTLVEHIRKVLQGKSSFSNVSPLQMQGALTSSDAQFERAASKEQL